MEGQFANWRKLRVPKTVETMHDDGRYGRFVVRPLERGFGVTLGNSLRRVLLGSLQGAAVTSIKIDGVLQSHLWGFVDENVGLLSIGISFGESDF